MRKSLIAVWIVLAVLASPGLGGERFGAGMPPATVADYDAQHQRSPRERYPDYVVRLFNLRRVMDASLPVEQRLESLAVVNRCGAGRGEAASQVAELLAAPNVPEPLQLAALEYLLRVGHQDAGQYVLRLLPRIDEPGALRDAIFNWLTRNPVPGALAELTQVWARQKAGGADEFRFRAVVERLSGAPWDQALANALNQPDFHARGSAIEILGSRLEPPQLKRLLLALPPKTVAMRAMQQFIDELGYVPVSGAELIQTVHATAVASRQPDLVTAAVATAQRWSRESGYVFNVRDFHLLSRLGRDPLRKDLPRKELIDTVRNAIVRAKPVRAVAAPQSANQTDDFVLQVDSLSHADLWNLHLLTQMLQQPVRQVQFGIVADQDRADTTGGWGGLVFYEAGQAMPKLYMAEPTETGDDLRYAEPRKLQVEGRDALCRFLCHFETRFNAARVGPTPEELLDAIRGNHYGLVLTALNGREFAAHYYNPRGQIVALGRYPFNQ